MRAVTWQGTRDMRVETVKDPEIVQQGDVIVKVSATAICGSDLHLYNHYITTMQKGDILMSLGGEAVNGLSGFNDVLKKHQPGDHVKLTWTRDGAPGQAEVELVAR